MEFNLLRGIQVEKRSAEGARFAVHVLASYLIPMSIQESIT